MFCRTHPVVGESFCRRARRQLCGGLPRAAALCQSHHCVRRHRWRSSRRCVRCPTGFGRRVRPQEPTVSSVVDANHPIALIALLKLVPPPAIARASFESSSTSDRRNMARDIDYSLYLVTGRDLLPPGKVVFSPCDTHLPRLTITHMAGLSRDPRRSTYVRVLFD